MTAKTANETSAPPGLEPVAHSTVILVYSIISNGLKPRFVHRNLKKSSNHLVIFLKPNILSSIFRIWLRELVMIVFLEVSFFERFFGKVCLDLLSLILVPRGSNSAWR